MSTLKHIPAELRLLPHWVGWRREERGGKATKVPIDPRSGAHASSTDPTTWGSFDEALAATKRYGCNGVGFVFSAEDPYAGVDLDACIDQDDELTPMAREIIESLDSYTEVSPSGNGLHCIVRGKVPARARKQGVLDGQKVEIYSQARFFCSTGAAIANGTSIGDRQAELVELCKRLKDTTQARDAESARLREGQGRNNELTRRLGLEVAKGVTGAELRQRAYKLNDFDPPLDEAEVEKILRSAEQWPTGKALSLRQHRTDSGNAERLIEAFGDRIRYCPAWGQWLAWDERRWAKDDVLEIEHLAKLALRRIHAEVADEADDDARKKLGTWAFTSESALRRMAAIECARSDPRIVVRPDQLDSDPWLFNCPNGTIDLRTGQLREHRREDLITKLAPVRFDARAKSAVWERLLEQATGGDREMQDFLARLAGYSLTGLATEEKLPFIYGPEATSKSTFLEALKSAWGDYAQTADFETFLKRNAVGNPRTDLARLAGARLVISIETEAGTRLADGFVKMITGGDRLVARKLYKDEFEFRPQFTLWWAANDAPRMSDRDGALWRRILEIPFTHQVPKSHRDPQVKAELTNPAIAGPAILAWAARGCLAWQRDGLGVPPVVEQATEELREEMNPLRDFFAERCVFESGALTPSGVLYGAYLKWCVACNERHHVSRREFGQRLGKRLGCKADHRRDGDWWPGIRLQDEAVEQHLDLDGQ
jgi:putative DNA primase/helicase